MSNIESLIIEDLARQYSAALGYQWADDRISRMVLDALGMMPQIGSASAVAVAFETELLLYGDPWSSQEQPRGLINC